MTCLEIRHRLLAEPAALDPEVREHLLSCRSCAAFAAEQNDFQRLLGRVLHVPAPEGLVPRILLRCRTAARAERARWRRAILIPAGLALAVGLIAAGAFMVLRNPPLAQSAIAHIEAELPHLSESGELPPAVVNSILRPFEVELAGDPGRVRYAGTCPIRGRKAAHLILAGERGAVTILLIQTVVLPRRQPIDHPRFEGWLVPVPGGCLAIVGERGEPLEAVERRLLAVLHFGAGDSDAGAGTVPGGHA
jgi:hypothetical protein